MRRLVHSVGMACSAASMLLLAALSISDSALAQGAPPATPKRPTQEVYFGTTIRDDFRWLEDWSSPETRAWVGAQNAYARAVLDSLPSRDAIRDRIAALRNSISPEYSDLDFRDGTLFALKDAPPKNQPMLVVLTSLDEPLQERVIVDPNLADSSGGLSIDFYVPSLDGSKVAVSLSRGGTEAGDLHLYDVATGGELGDVLPRVNGGTAGGSVAWTADDAGLFYTRYPRPGERPEGDADFYQQAWFHRIGSPASADTCVLGPGLPKIAEIAFESTDDGRYLLIQVKNGDGGDVGWWLRGPDGATRAVAGFGDRVTNAVLGGDALFLLSRARDGKGEVLRVPLDAPSLAGATTVVPTGSVAIETVHWAGNHLYVVDIHGGWNDLRVCEPGPHASPSTPRTAPGTHGPLNDRAPHPILMPRGAVTGFSRWRDGQCLVRLESYTRPPYWVRYDPMRRVVLPTPMAMRSPADFGDVEERHESAVSRDGTRVPVTLLLRRGTRIDGRAPLLLYGYGGFALSEKPNFDPARRLWLEQGGIWAVAHIRGGLEYGDAWHQAGRLTRKQNVFDDFAAAARTVVRKRYPRRDRLAIEGGSNGGLLVGASLTQHPELFRAAVAEVGVLDMLLAEKTPNGQFNTSEFGSVRDSAQFRALLAYSPYHNVREGTEYPATLLLASTNDPRVAPGNSFKFAARLQASGTREPVLLRTSMTTGHIGTPLNARNEEEADVDAFLMDRLGLRYDPERARMRPQRYGLSGSAEGSGEAAGWLASTAYLAFVPSHRGAWTGGANAAFTLAMMAYNGDKETGRWPWGSRLTYLAGMGGLVAYDFARGDETGNGVLFLVNLGVTGITFQLADWLWVKKPR